MSAHLQSLHFYIVVLFSHLWIYTLKKTLVCVCVCPCWSSHFESVAWTICKCDFKHSWMQNEPLDGSITLWVKTFASECAAVRIKNTDCGGGEISLFGGGWVAFLQPPIIWCDLNSWFLQWRYFTLYIYFCAENNLTLGLSAAFEFTLSEMILAHHLFEVFWLVSPCKQKVCTSGGWSFCAWDHHIGDISSLWHH